MFRACPLKPPACIFQVTTHTIMIGPIVGWITLPANSPKIAVIYLFAVLVHNQSVPVTIAVYWLAQLACKR